MIYILNLISTWLKEIQLTILTAIDRQAVVDMIHRYFWLVDHGRADQIAALFAPDGRLTFGPGAPNPGTIEGSAIATVMLARAKQTDVTTRHVVSNIMISKLDETRASSNCLLTLYKSTTSQRDSYPTSIADVEDTYVKAESNWLIQTRVITPIFNRG